MIPDRSRALGITIDGPTSRDLDDAVWAERDADGWTVSVSIADVAESIDVGDELDQHAQDQVVTIYQRERTKPMLPRWLSENKLSLLAGEARNTITATIRLDHDLTPRAPLDLALTTTRSRSRLTYEDIPALLTPHQDPATAPHPGLVAQVKGLAELAQGLLRRRRDGGALALYDLNSGWATTEEGHVKQLVSAQQNVGYIVIAELMILANAEIARFALEQNVPILFRNHVAHAAVPNREAMMATIESAMLGPVQGIALLRARTHMLLNRANYGAAVEGHYGLALPCYTHFTSPIRRFPDLVTHRQLRAHLLGEPLPYTRADLDAIASHVNDVLQMRRSEREAYLRAKADTAGQKALDEQLVATSTPAIFERAVKLAARSGEDVDAGFSEAFVSRLSSKNVPLSVMAVALIEAPRLPGWIALGAAILTGLRDGAADGAISILTMAKDLYGWSDPVWTTMRHDLDGGPFSASVTVVVNGSKHTSPHAYATTKKAANSAAAVALLAVICGIDIGQPIALPGLVSKKRTLVRTMDAIAAGKSPIMVVLEHAQVLALPAPEYTFTSAGLVHAPVFACVCRFDGLVTTGKGSKKNTAKEAAAKALAQKLDERIAS